MQFAFRAVSCGNPIEFLLSKGTLASMPHNIPSLSGEKSGSDMKSPAL